MIYERGVSLAANAYSAAAYPLRILDRIDINGRDVLNGVMGIADKVRNKEYGALAKGQAMRLVN